MSAPGTPGYAPLLEVTDLSVSFDTAYGKVEAVNGLSFAVGQRERVGLVGESGSGKSVTAQALFGLLRGAEVSGSIRFAGTELIGLPEPELRALRGWDFSYVFQDPLSALDPVQTIGSQVSSPLRLRGVGRAEARERAIEMLDRVGIRNPRDATNQYPHEFSGGMRQRVMIAMALIGDPRLVVADEPTTALDVRVQQQVIDLLFELTEERGVAVLFITHDLGILAGFAQRMMVMYAGRLMESGLTDDIYYRSLNPYTRGLLASLPRINGPVADRLATIGGTPPAPSQLPAGCPFHARCPMMIEACRTTRPLLEIPVGGTHPSACLRSDELVAAPEIVR